MLWCLINLLDHFFWSRSTNGFVSTAQSQKKEQPPQVQTMNSASRWVSGRQKGVFLLVELGQYKLKGFAACWAGGGGFSKAFASVAPAHCLKVSLCGFL